MKHAWRKSKFYYH